ncbi:DUF3667 domain-containing protein [Neolewinella agarilytica]|nr:DUF3667 domain-containing protein [Neolewinella agarilytica]
MNDPLPPEDHRICTCCGEPMWPADRYCADCGQKAFDGPPGFWQMLGEFFETVFSLDNRLFRTLQNLLFPGRLTNRFLAGKQRPYFQPLRLFFISSVLMVGAFTIVATDAIGDSLEKEMERKKASAYHDLYADKLKVYADSLLVSFPKLAHPEVMDSLENLFGRNQSDSMQLGYMDFYSDNEMEVGIMVSTEDARLLTPDELVKKYKVKGWLNQYQLKQIVRLESRLNVNIIAAAMGQLVWGLVLLVPIVTLLLKLVYIRRKRLYVEHFIFSLHVHSFFFLLMFLSAIELYFFRTVYLLLGSLVVSAFYFVKSLKNVYQQGWWKTIIKSVILFYGYFVALVTILTLSVIAAIALF